MGKVKLYWIAGGLGLLAAFYAMAKHSAQQPAATFPTTADASGGGGGVAGYPANPTPGSSGSGVSGTHALIGILPGGVGWDASPPPSGGLGVPPPAPPIGHPPPLK